jgi:hypothetical protein
LGVREGWAYASAGLTIEPSATDSFTWPTPPIATGDRYVLEMEFCLRRVDAGRWIVGFTFAREKSNDYLTLFLSGTELVALQVRDGGPTGFADPVSVGKIEIDAWHRFAVDVDGIAVKAWFDGRVVLEAKLSNVKGLAGACGLYHQANRCEIRRLRLGTKEAAR